MNEFNTVGMIAVSADELEQTEGGIGSGVIYCPATQFLTVGEVLPGFNAFLEKTKAIAAGRQ